MDIVGKENARSRKDKVVFPKGGGEAINPENMEDLYESVWLWGMEEEDDIPFPPLKRVYEYRDHVDPTSLSANFADVFLELAILLNYCVEWTVILNYIIQDNNKVVGGNSNKTFKFHRMESSMEEAVFTFQSVAEAEQQNGGPQQKRPLAEN